MEGRSGDGRFQTRVAASSPGGEERAVSDVIAFAILVGIVVTGAVLVAASGERVIDETTGRSASMAVTTTLHEVDSRLTSAAHGGSADLAFATERLDGYRIDRRGSVSITIANGTCSTTLPLTSLGYETEGGERLAYEAGGVWESTSDGSRPITAPDLRYRNRTIHLSVVNLSGRISRSSVTATELDSSERDTRGAVEALYAERPCVRPDAVTILVRSERYRAWGRYLADEFGLRVGGAVTIDDESRTARVAVPGRMLPVEADDDRNRVVDFVDGYGQFQNGTFAVEKGSPTNTYPLSVTLLSNETQGGRPTVTVDRRRQPIDVVFTLDESGSMADDPDGDGASKLSETETAALGFVDELNESVGDRIGVVGYSDTYPCSFFTPCPPYYPDDARVHEGLTNDFDDVEESLEMDLRADGSTPIAAGINRSVDHFVVEGTDSRERVVVVLSDGQHNGDGNVTAAAERAARHNVTIYTVGFGDDVGESFLKTAANRTGGAYYHASDGEALADRFQDIALEVSRSRSVRPLPVTLQAGPETLLPNGSLRRIPPNGTAHGLKDPGLSFPIAYSTDLRDGEELPLTLTYWDCEAWAHTNETMVGPDGHAFEKARCTAASTRNVSINGTSAPERIRVYTAANTTADIPDGTGSWAETNVSRLLGAYGYLDAGENLALASNEVVLVYDLPGDGSADFNDVVAVVDVGYATDEVSVRYAVSVSVSNVRVGPRP